jgi:hypothetical protein
MSTGIVYYSKQCRHSIQLLQALQRHPQKNDIYYIPIDRRRVMANGAVYVIMDNGQEVMLPPHIKQVPAYVSFAHGGRVFLGNDITAVLFPRGAMPHAPTASIASAGGGAMGGGGRDAAAAAAAAASSSSHGFGMNRGSPGIGFSQGPMGAATPYMGGRGGGGGAPRPMPPAEPSAFSFGDHCSMSDSFSFLDQSADELKATGNGGMRQLHGFTALNGGFEGINTPPEDYVPNKVGGDVSLDRLREEREKDVPKRPGPYSNI